MIRRLILLLVIAVLVGCGQPAPTAPARLLAAAPNVHTAVNGETIYIPAGVSVTVVNGNAPTQSVAPTAQTSPSSSSVPQPSVSPTPTAAPTPTPQPTPRTITCQVNVVCLTPKAGETVSDVTLVGPGDTTYDGRTVGILVNQPNVTIRNVTIRGFGDSCIRVDGATAFLIETSTITDCAYAGIITTGATKGTIRGNLVQRIGTRGHQRDANAYGIVASMWSNGAPSADIAITGNTVEDVPTWHCFDTHGGQRVNFAGNTARRCPRPFFITSSDATRATGTILNRNVMLEPVSLVGKVAGATNPVAITLYDTRTTTATDNLAAAAFPSPVVYDYAALSTELIDSGNRRAS